VTAARTFPLVPHRRFVGASFGRDRSVRRGQGDEVVGSRPYRPGDHLAWIDWAASARLSAARGTDEFVVREYFAQEAPRAHRGHSCRSELDGERNAVESPTDLDNCVGVDTGDELRFGCGRSIDEKRYRVGGGGVGAGRWEF